MKKKMMLILAIVIVASVGLVAVSAFRGDTSVQGPNYDSDIHEQMEAAMDDGDYEAWVSIRKENGLPIRGRMFSAVNEDNFDLFVQMHEANMAGDYETAAGIRTELGFGTGHHGRHGTGTGGEHPCGMTSGAPTSRWAR